MAVMHHNLMPSHTSSAASVRSAEWASRRGAAQQPQPAMQEALKLDEVPRMAGGDAGGAAEAAQATADEGSASGAGSGTAPQVPSMAAAIRSNALHSAGGGLPRRPRLLASHRAAVRSVFSEVCDTPAILEE
jgi:hypothetical protein